MYKKHEWIKYGRNDNIINIEIKDSTERKIDSFRCNNQEDYTRIMKIIKEKYGYSPEIDTNDSVNNKEKKDIDWLGSDELW